MGGEPGKLLMLPRPRPRLDVFRGIMEARRSRAHMCRQRKLHRRLPRADTPLWQTISAWHRKRSMPSSYMDRVDVFPALVLHRQSAGAVGRWLRQLWRCLNSRWCHVQHLDFRQQVAIGCYPTASLSAAIRRPVRPSFTVGGKS